jgi:DNA-binding NarL/FixJ family response regulator
VYAEPFGGIGNHYVFIEAAQSEVTSKSRRMTRILIVDDSVQVRTALRICLRMNKDWIVCGEAANGRDAIDLAARMRPDVLLLDYAMPEMNGLEAARTLSVLVPECAILMFTLFATPQLSELARAAGVRAVLSKDVNGISTVIEAIEAIASISAEHT